MTHRICSHTRSTSVLLGLSLALAACGPSGGSITSGGNGNVITQNASAPVNTAFADGPLYLTGAFDGSRSFFMWVDTISFARSVNAKFTYFINSCYYDPKTTGSAIGKAGSDLEAMVRFALTQQAINEGHEIGNHTVRHLDGGKWSRSQWQSEMANFHRVVDTRLFEPVLNSDGTPLFPKWVSRNSAGRVGSSCSTSSQCNSGQCLAVTPTQGFCTASCSSGCPSGTVCGIAGASSDVCVPVPEYPVVDGDGNTVFDSNGLPNLDNPILKPYRIKGFRAPQLAKNVAMYETLESFGYTYDTSMVLKPIAPRPTRIEGVTFESILQFPLMRNAGSAAIPMDYNYYVNDVSGERMLSDYQSSVTDGYNQRSHQPWNIGHHFSLWKGGAYWQAMKDTYRFALKGCLDSRGNVRCEQVAFVTFDELHKKVTSMADAHGDGFYGPSAGALTIEENQDNIVIPAHGEDAH